MHRDLSDILELLETDKKIYNIMKQCPYEVLREIRFRHYEKKSFVLAQGEIHNVFYIMVDGKADIYVESEHGKKYLLNTYGRGQYIGELEMFQQAPYVSSVEAQDDVSVLEIDRDVFLKWIHEDRNFSEFLMRTLCDSTYVMCRNMGNNTLYTLKQRICRYFIANADKNGSFSTEMYTETLGERMAVAQRSVNRVIKQLKEKGIIDVGKHGAVIMDYEALLRESEVK